MKHLKKFTSRKFLISLASFLASLGMAVQGISQNNEKLQAVSVIAMTVSSGIYAVIEGVVDKKGVEENAKDF